MLIGIQYYSIAAVDLNDNVIGLGLWPFMVYAGFQAYRTRYLRYWLLGGIAAGLAMMTKYYAIIPVICLLSFFIIEPKARGAFKEWGIYLATGIAFLICLPHLLWLPKHNWITITYAQSKVHMTHPHWGWINHFIYATHFAGVQIGTFCGALILLACLAIKAQSNTAVKLSSDFKRFILINALGPFDLTLLISVIFGWKLNTLWGMPLLSLWPLVILTYWRPVITPKRLKIFITTSLVIWTLLLIGYTIGKTHTGSHSSANIPGKQLSQLIRQKWRNHFHTPLKYCAGNRYLCGYVAYFSPHPISIYIDWNPILSSWINPTRFKQKGAVFLVFANKMHTFPQHILQQYPNLQTTQKMQLIYHRAKRQHPSLNVLMAFLPPA
jgi:hypothetical protein